MPIGSTRERNLTIEYGYSSCDDIDEEEEEEKEAGGKEKGRVKRPGRQRDRRVPPQYPRPHSHLFRTPSGKRARGNKHARRWENSAFLSVYQVTEEELAEDHSLILPSHTSPFKHLLTDSSKLKKWHMFTELPEDQQQKLTKQSPSSRCSGHGADKTEDGRSALRRIDSSIRSQLMHNRRTPVEYIDNLEKEAIELFGDDSSSAVVFLQPSGYHRMLLHAVCQYLGLSSKTEWWGGKGLMVVVECASVFSPPNTALTTVLYQRPNLTVQ